MEQAERAAETATWTVLCWGVILSAAAVGAFFLRDSPLRQSALRAVLSFMAAGELLAAAMLVFRAPRMAQMAGRIYSTSYHGLVQDFGFYNLAIALLLALCAVDPERNRVVLPVALVLYGVHGGTHLLRYFGLYYGGETRIPTRPATLELRDALPLLAGLVGILLFS